MCQPTDVASDCVVEMMTSTPLSKFPQFAHDRVAPGRHRPGAPTDPYVRALAHTVPLIMDLLRA